MEKKIQILTPLAREVQVYPNVPLVTAEIGSSPFMTPYNIDNGKIKIQINVYLIHLKYQKQQKHFNIYLI